MMMVYALAFAKEGFFVAKEEGWHFYKDAQRLPEEKQPKNMAELKQQVQECLEQAIFNPTQQNIRRYQQVQKQLVERSQKFANRWVQSLLETPALDHTLKVPPSYYGALAHKKQIQGDRTRKILAGQNTYGLFLFVGKDDDYASKALWDVVSRFADYRRYTLNILMTEEAPSTLPGAVSDQGLKAAWHIKRLPALVMNHIDSGRFGVITYGLMASDAIEERMVELMEAWS